MAFTGVPVFQVISTNIVRITGLKLEDSATGKIGLAAKTVPSEITLPPQFQPDQYGGPAGVKVPLVASLDVDFKYIGVGGNISPAPLVTIDKAGDDPQNWEATFKNQRLMSEPSEFTNEMEIYIKFHE